PHHCINNSAHGWPLSAASLALFPNPLLLECIFTSSRFRSMTSMQDSPSRPRFVLDTIHSESHFSCHHFIAFI
ncbi:hypothetical protein WG66_003305, partial [Moniliophthora roreri]